MPAANRAAVLCAIVSAACLAPGEPDALPSAEFGTVTAVIDGRAWTSSILTDSWIGFYDAGQDRLQIQGQRVQPGPWPSLMITIPGLNGPGRYSLSGLPSAGQWFTTGRRRQLLAYATTGHEADEVVIEALDLQAGLLRGSFTVTPQLLHSTSKVAIHGQFWGRVAIAP